MTDMDMDMDTVRFYGYGYEKVAEIHIHIHWGALCTEDLTAELAKFHPKHKAG
jgi:hypothetical protein